MSGRGAHALRKVPAAQGLGVALQVHHEPRAEVGLHLALKEPSKSSLQHPSTLNSFTTSYTYTYIYCTYVHIYIYTCVYIGLENT